MIPGNLEGCECCDVQFPAPFFFRDVNSNLKLMNNNINTTTSKPLQYTNQYQQQKIIKIYKHIKKRQQWTHPPLSEVPMRAARCKGVFPKKSWPLICGFGNSRKVGGMMIMLIICWPIGSMYGIFTYIYHTFMPIVGKYNVHGYYGWCYRWFMRKKDSIGLTSLRKP